MQEIKPCPFCGGEAEKDEHVPFVVVCTRCGATVDGLEGWNKRVGSPQPIETAPKDGTIILIYTEDSGYSNDEGSKWFMAQYREYLDRPEWSILMAEYETIDNPTYWTTLPPDP